MVEGHELVVIRVRDENGEQSGRFGIARVFAHGVMRARLFDPVFASMKDPCVTTVHAAADRA